MCDRVSLYLGLGFVFLSMIWIATAEALDPELTITQYVQNVWRAPQQLPHDNIASIVQSRDGYLWIGTVEGLARFDGVRSVVFDKSNTPPMSNNWIRALVEDRDGRLWIGTFGGGLVCRQNGQFINFGVREGLPGDIILSIFEDRKGHVLVGTAGSGLFRFQNGRFTQEPGTGDLSSSRIQAITEDRNDVLWIGTEAGLYSLAGEKLNRWTRGSGLSDDSVISLAADAHGLWIGTEKGGLNRLVQGQFSAITTRQGLSHNRIWSLFVDRDQNLWIGTDGGGLHRWSRGKLNALTTKNGLTNDYVWAIHEDREGSLWIGTNGGGLNRLKNARVVSMTTREGLPSDFIWTILRTQDRSLWAGTEDQGLVRVQEDRITTFTVSHGLTGNARVLFQSEDGTLWIGGNQGLDIWKDGRIVPSGIPGVSGITITAIAEDHLGSLWIGTNGAGLKQWKDGQMQEFSRTQGLLNDSVTSLFVASDGSIWIGTLGGVNHFVGQRLAGISGVDGLPSEYVTSLFEGPDGSIWVGSRGGLVRIRNGRVYQVITLRHGLCDDAIMSAVLGNDGAIWMGSNRGISRASLQEMEDVLRGGAQKINCIAFDMDDGMKSVEVNSGGSSHWKDPDGRLYFATRGGIVSLNPKRMRFNREPPPVLIEEMMAGENRLEGGGSWTLPAGTRNLEIHFTALTLLSPLDVQFKRMLEGFDSDWTDAGPDRTAYYTNVPHGRYRFRVIAANSDGVWNEKGAGMDIEIEPRFYDRLSFRILVLLVIAGAGPIFYMIRVRRLRSQKTELERLVAERTAEVQAANARLEQLAREDALTGVANRRRLDEAAHEEWRRAHRNGTMIALLLIDVDFFKIFNDHRGHLAGDECLKTVAQTAASVCKRAGELVARFGGEEFAVLMPGVTEKDAKTTAEIIRAKVQSLSMHHPMSVAPVITVSVGVACVKPSQGGSVSTLFDAADRALYRAKQSGRNRVECFGTLSSESNATPV